MPRYEFSEGTSNKFWEIELEGSSFTTTYGKIGTDGQSTEKSFASPAEAKKAYDKLVAEKVKKGYELVDGGDSDDDDDGDDDEGGGGASNAELEKAILKNPDDAAAYLVYADWLQGQGDPRGELIALQAAGPGKAAAAAAYLEKHGPALLGGLADLATTNDKPSFTWRWGFIQKLHLARGYDENLEIDGEELEDLGAALAYVLKHPAGRFITELEIGVNNGDGEAEYGDVVEALAASPRPALRKLHLANFEYPDEIEMSWTHLGDLGGLWAKMPGLTELVIQGGDFELGQIVLPELKRAAFRTGGLGKSALESICSATWPKLESLEIRLGTDNYGGECAIGDLQAIFDGKNLPALKHLGLMNSDFSDEIAAAIGKSKIIKQLTSLDLSMGTLSDTGAAAMVADKAAFAHLEELDLDESYLTETDTVAKLAKKVVGLDNQRDGGDDDRYVSVGE